MLLACSADTMAAKVLDGLFIGDALSSFDVNFLVANKITRVVNCAGLDLDNQWRRLGIKYITFDWPAPEGQGLDVLRQGPRRKRGRGAIRRTCTKKNCDPFPTSEVEEEDGSTGEAAESALQLLDLDQQEEEEDYESEIVFSSSCEDSDSVGSFSRRLFPVDNERGYSSCDGNSFSLKDDDDVLKSEGSPCIWFHELSAFVESSLDAGEGVLIHSQDGRNRACSCVLVYLMGNYGWDLGKALAFVQCSNRPDLFPRPELLSQLQVMSDWASEAHGERLKSAIADQQQLQSLLSQKFVSWETDASELCRVSLRAEKELVLQNTFINSGLLYNKQRVESEAKPNPSVWKNSETNLTYASVLLGASPSAPPKPPRKNSKKVVWIDSEQAVSSGVLVPRSPFSKRPIPERPPGPSYSSLQVSGFWQDAEESQADKGGEEQAGASLQQNESPISWASALLLSPSSSEGARKLSLSPQASPTKNLSLSVNNSCSKNEPTESPSPKQILDDLKCRHQNTPLHRYSAESWASAGDILQDQNLDWNHLRQRLLSNGMAAESTRSRKPRANKLRSEKEKLDYLAQAKIKSRPSQSQLGEQDQVQRRQRTKQPLLSKRAPRQLQTSASTKGTLRNTNCVSSGNPSKSIPQQKRRGVDTRATTTKTGQKNENSSSNKPIRRTTVGKRTSMATTHKGARPRAREPKNV